MTVRRSRTVGYNESFVSERALCEALEAAVRANGWAWYPETSGWDAIAVLPDGTQVGVQAKLRANVEVLCQAIPERETGDPALRPGVDVRAVLVTNADSSFRRVAAELRLAVLRGVVVRGDVKEWFGFDGVRGAECVDTGAYVRRVVDDAPRHQFSQRGWLPPFEPNVAAGVPSPRQVTPWRIAAAKMCAQIRAGLEPTAADLAAAGMNVSRWRTWLDPVDGTKPRRYRLRRNTYLPDTNWPDVSLKLGLPPPPSLYGRTGRFDAEPEPTWGVP